MARARMSDEERRAKAVASTKRYLRNNPEYRKAARKRWKLKNPELWAAYKAKSRLKHRDKALAKSREHYRKNKAKYMEYDRKRRARLAGCEINDFTDEQWPVVLAVFGGRCAYCGCGGTMTVDHIIPLSKGGNHTVRNIAPACIECNRSKYNKVLRCNPWTWRIHAVPMPFWEYEEMQKLIELTPEQRLKHQAVIVERERGWVVMDKLGTTFLCPSIDPSYPCHVISTPHLWPSRKAARDAYNAWSGTSGRKAGRKKENPLRPKDNNAQIKFERLFGCLMHLWKMYPAAITLDSVQRHIQAKMQREFHQRTFRKDMEALVRFGYAVKAGPTYTAVPEFRRWWSDEFGDKPTPKTEGT